MSTPLTGNPDAMTMEKIAQELNLSRTTVYRVAHNKPYVKESTRQAVLELIAKYDFQPNIAAQNLVTEKTRTIGVVFENLTVAFRNMLAQYLVREINQRAHRVILQILDENDPGQFLELVKRDVLGRRIDGLVLDVDPHYAEHPAFSSLIEKMRQRRFPFVFLSAMRNVDGVPFVCVDRALGSCKAVSHLIRLGRRRIALVSSGFDRHIVNLDLRLEGYRKALRDAGIEEEKQLLIPIEQGEYEDGYRAGHFIAGMPNRPQAVFCVNDTVAVGMLKAFREAGVVVPRDIAIVGFDNIEASAYASVPLTTVDQPIRQIAEEGVRMLFDRMSNPDMPVKQVYVEPQVVVRDSCGARGN